MRIEKKKNNYQKVPRARPLTLSGAEEKQTFYKNSKLRFSWLEPLFQGPTGSSNSLGLVAAETANSRAMSGKIQKSTQLPRARLPVDAGQTNVRGGTRPFHKPSLCCEQIGHIDS